MMKFRIQKPILPMYINSKMPTFEQCSKALVVDSYWLANQFSQFMEYGGPLDSKGPSIMWVTRVYGVHICRPMLSGGSICM